MDEREFNAAAELMLQRLEQLFDECELGLDYEVLPGGVIELSFEHGGGSKIIINRHAAAREIWVAARSGGFHFSPDPAKSGRWFSTREQEDLLSCLSRCISAQAGVSMSLT